MAQAWRGTGSGFAEIPSMRMGNGAPSQRVRLMTWNGSAFVDRWVKPMQYRLVSTSTVSGTGTSYLTLAGANYQADPAYPYTLYSSGLVIPASVPVVNYNVTATFPCSGGAAPRYGQGRILLNGNVIAGGNQATGSPDTSTATWTGQLAPGDVLTCQWRGEGNFFNRPTLQAGAVLQAFPVIQV